MKESSEVAPNKGKPKTKVMFTMAQITRFIKWVLRIDTGLSKQNRFKE